MTAIGNSTDTAALIAARASVTPTQSQDVREQYDAYGPTALFVGGIDSSKRIDFLLDAAKHAALADDAFRLLVAGAGALDHLLREPEYSRFVKPVGRAGPTDLARLASITSMIWMPGRVGLIAVDALALGLQVHTVSSSFHAPELDFLTEGISLATLPDDPKTFALESLRRARDASTMSAPATIPTLEAVSTAFVETILNSYGLR